MDTLLFLDEFQLKDAHEKQAFFTELKNELDLFPDNIAKYRILPKLIHVCSLFNYLKLLREITKNISIDIFSK